MTIERSKSPTTVFTDGAAKGNPGPGGWAAIVVAAGRVRELGGGSRHTTNNRMELTGPIEALSHLKETPGRVTVHTDSTYVIRGIREWIPSWQRRGWRTMEGKDVLNRELWERLWTLTQNHEGGVEWHYVRGHVGIPGNERVTRSPTRMRCRRILAFMKDRLPIIPFGYSISPRTRIFLPQAAGRERTQRRIRT